MRERHGDIQTANDTGLAGMCSRLARLPIAAVHNQGPKTFLQSFRAYQSFSEAIEGLGTARAQRGFPAG